MLFLAPATFNYVDPQTLPDSRNFKLQFQTYELFKKNKN